MEIINFQIKISMSTIKFSHYKFFVRFVKFFVKLEYLLFFIHLLHHLYIKSTKELKKISKINYFFINQHLKFKLFKNFSHCKISKYYDKIQYLLANF